MNEEDWDTLKKYSDIEEQIWNNEDDLEQKIQDFIDENEDSYERIQYILIQSSFYRPKQFLSHMKIISNLMDIYGLTTNELNTYLPSSISNDADIYGENTIANIILTDNADKLLEKLADINFNINGVVNFSLHGQPTMTYIDAAAFFGCLNVFKVLLCNNALITTHTFENSICGGNYEIIHLSKLFSSSLAKNLSIAVRSHQNEVIDWLLQDNDDVPLSALDIIAGCNTILLFDKKIDYIQKGILQSCVRAGYPYLKLAVLNGAVDNKYLALELSVSSDKLNYFNLLIENLDFKPIQILQVCLMRYELFVKTFENFKPKLNLENDIKFLMQESVSRFPQVAKYLIDNIDDIRFRYNKNETLLHIVAKQCVNPLIIEILVKKGFFVSEKNDDGDTPLIIAVRNRTLNAIPTLINYGADPWIENNKGESAFKLANDDSTILAMLQTN
ncbi:hypothetical protein TVAG_141950 [Trichomonas vaginalis G3]|uniref:DUF3447 domain-containing protein n=1 Tax=Trichomonas vaginalis (strain ATCC PRA-98 / G3) TaxID=412133 RepID=A2FWQ8_TRIV3|nr:Ankyrin repeat family [Trichomonas vaginalis G3]EAX90651.1 hypothetical protein TVAG_141950 [Trichomonas vaginalis G3]KAI5553839.1 Ankyrin repeat family [Trichomonas vaginalis G3]|eukprot:XP_001303581.1 hypothetical protein [Trichomonas vaginalis G3]